MFKRKKADERVAEILRQGEEVTKKVMRLSREDSLHVYVELRENVWPYSLGGPPDIWQELNDQEKCHLLMDAIQHIENRIPLKERKRFERKMRYDETEAQFEDWWESRWFELLERIAARLS